MVNLSARAAIFYKQNVKLLSECVNIQHGLHHHVPLIYLLVLYKFVFIDEW